MIQYLFLIPLISFACWQLWDMYKYYRLKNSIWKHKETGELYKVYSPGHHFIHVEKLYPLEEEPDPNDIEAVIRSMMADMRALVPIPRIYFELEYERVPKKYLEEEIGLYHLRNLP